MSQTIPASEFTRNFGRYRMVAQREAVAVSSHGQITGYFIGPEEYEAFRRYHSQRRAFLAQDLPDADIDAMTNTRMNSKHDHLNALIDDE